MLFGKDKESIDRLLESVSKVRPASPWDSSDSLSAPVHYEAFDHLLECSDRFYSKKRYLGSGLGQGPAAYETTVVAPVEEVDPELGADAIFLWPGGDQAKAEQDLKKLLLFSNFLLVILPTDLHKEYISYSSPSGRVRKLNLNALEDCLKFNSQYSFCVDKHSLVFLPRKLSSYHEDTHSSEFLIYEAPLEQSPEEMPYVPYNASALENIKVLETLALPFFPSLAIEDLIRIKMNESESFFRFQHFLRKKLKSLSEAGDLIAAKNVALEIEDEVRRLNFEAARLANLRVMRGVTLGAFTISVGAMLLPQNEILRDVAGFLGSASLLQIFNQYYERKSKLLDLKKDTFYIPYLFSRNLSKSQD